MNAPRWSRRSLLGAGASTLGLNALGAAAPARSRDRRKLVVLQLFGGNDGLNTLVPIEDDDYHRARPTLRIPKGTALALDGRGGGHSHGVAVVEATGGGDTPVDADSTHPAAAGAAGSAASGRPAEAEPAEAGPVEDPAELDPEASLRRLFRLDDDQGERT